MQQEIYPADCSSPMWTPIDDNFWGMQFPNVDAVRCVKNRAMRDKATACTSLLPDTSTFRQNLNLAHQADL